MNKVLLISIMFCFFIVANPIFMQRTTYQSIDESKFKKYKIKRLGFLFKGMQCQSASTHGVILPMLVLQIQGYILGILTFSFLFINKIFNLIEEPIAAIIIIIVFFIDLFVCILTTEIAGFISKKTKRKYL